MSTSGSDRNKSRGSSSQEVGGEQVEGINAVLELLRVGRRKVKNLWIADSRGEDGAPMVQIIEYAIKRGIPVWRVSAAEITSKARTEAPQGVIAHAERIRATEFSTLLDDPLAFLVALDGVTDPRNLGAIIRSAVAAGATAIVLPAHRSAHITPAAAKAAAGAIEHIAISIVGGIPAAIDRAKRAGVWSVGLVSEGTSELFGLKILDGPVMLVLGAEGAGISPLARKRCDVLANIPMIGAVDSLNVSAAATLACFEVTRSRVSR